jgi:hypothetical protein
MLGSTPIVFPFLLSLGIGLDSRGRWGLYIQIPGYTLSQKGLKLQGLSLLQTRFYIALGYNMLKWPLSQEYKYILHCSPVSVANPKAHRTIVHWLCLSSQYRGRTKVHEPLNMLWIICRLQEWEHLLHPQSESKTRGWVVVISDSLSIWHPHWCHPAATAEQRRVITDWAFPINTHREDCAQYRSPYAPHRNTIPWIWNSWEPRLLLQLPWTLLVELYVVCTPAFFFLHLGVVYRSKVRVVSKYQTRLLLYSVRGGGSYLFICAGLMHNSDGFLLDSLFLC